MTRALALIILIAAIVAIIALRERPARLAIEPVPAGKAQEMPAANMLLAPCPLTVKNLPPKPRSNA